MQWKVEVNSDGQ